MKNKANNNEQETVKQLEIIKELNKRFKEEYQNPR